MYHVINYASCVGFGFGFGLKFNIYSDCALHSLDIRPFSLQPQAMTSLVKLYVYDLSNGMARQMSRQLTGKQIDGIW